ETEAARAAGVAIGDQAHRFDRAVLREHVSDFTFGSGERQIADIDLRHNRIRLQKSGTGLGAPASQVPAPYTHSKQRCAGRSTEDRAEGACHLDRERFGFSWSEAGTQGQAGGRERERSRAGADDTLRFWSRQGSHLRGGQPSTREIAIVRYVTQRA